jgi:hypothetical protein
MIWLKIRMSKAWIFQGVFLNLFLGCNPCWDSKNNDEIIQCLARYPSEDILVNPKVASYLKNHKVYVSLSSSPKRTKKNILYALKTWDLSLVDTVFLSLPMQYRDKEVYELSPQLLEFEKLKIIHRPKDLGPIMKLLPMAEEVQKLGDLEAIMIIADDDIGLGPGVFGQLIKEVILYDAVASSGLSDTFGYNGLKSSDWPRRPAVIYEGYRGMAFKAKHIDIARLTYLSQVSDDKACRNSDDVVISYVLAESNTQVRRISNRFTVERPFDFGFDEDALHFGSGYKKVDSANPQAERYQKCLRDILQDAK